MTFDIDTQAHTWIVRYPSYFFCYAGGQWIFVSGFIFLCVFFLLSFARGFTIIGLNGISCIFTVPKIQCVLFFFHYVFVRFHTMKVNKMHTDDAGDDTTTFNNRKDQKEREQNEKQQQHMNVVKHGNGKYENK